MTEAPYLHPQSAKRTLKKIGDKRTKQGPVKRLVCGLEAIDPSALEFALVFRIRANLLHFADEERMGRFFTLGDTAGTGDGATCFGKAVIAGEPSGTFGHEHDAGSENDGPNEADSNDSAP